MKNIIIFILSGLGLAAGLVAAYIFGLQRPAQPPLFKPISSPYDSAIFANGIIESEQASGSNINIYPEVAGPVIQVLVHEGQPVTAGTALLSIDQSVQSATTAQLGLQADAALTVLKELNAEPRPETLAITMAQVVLADSNLKVALDQYNKRQVSFDLDPKSISQDELDNAHDAVHQAEAAREVARKQNDLTKAGAWSYDLANQEKQYAALNQAYLSSQALLAKFTVKAKSDGIVLAVNPAVGTYVSTEGVYDTYTQGFDPVIVMGTPQEYLCVRCFVDEILVSRLPTSFHIKAEMSIRGTETKIPLEFVRVQPYIGPKIELSDERLEQVDLRVLPVIFRFPKQDSPVYPGQEVDVYIGSK